jgi:hypothetical protein
MAEPPQAVFLPMQITLGALADIGIEGDDAMRAYYLLVNFTLGQTAYEVHGPFEGLEAPSGAAWDFDRAFEFGLRTILAGLAAQVGSD